ncbi:MAG TPA: ATP-binding cassette domain-containing protein [Tepidisphaeraceae bacterium]|jgi:ABC-2 type transport system ATP-binding protein|nr:ATP-binding cassette domain-containing protein [Tepidisphaeraceae bacterium]
MLAIVDIRNLTRAYAERTAVNDLSLAVSAGEIFGFLGPNGSGKTTLFRILSTLMPATSGEVVYNFSGSSFTLGASSLFAIRQHLGVVFQSPSLDNQLTPYENLRHHGHLYGLRGAELARRIETLLGRVNLLDRMNDRVGSFSGGMRRRVEIAKGLLNHPALLLLDEPSTGLDPGARIDLWSYLRQIQAEGVTILVTTHLMEEADLCSRLAIMHQGRAVAVGTPTELKSQIGGDVITLQSPEPEKALGFIKERLGLTPTRWENTLRIEHADGAHLIPRLIEALPNLVDSISVGKPTLQDVFIRTTGHRLSGDIPGQP